MILLLLFLPLAGEPAAKFILPATRVIMSQRQVEFPAQAWVKRHEENRRMEISWFGEGCAGSHAWDIDPDSAQVQPTYAPLKVTATPGICELSLKVFGPGDKLRATASLTVTVCGGDVECF